MRLALVFLAVFLVGPLCFRWLTRHAPSRQSQRALIFFCAMMAGGGLLLRYGSGAWGQDVVSTILGVVMVWFAWIGVLAYGAQALRAADPSARMRRWTGVLGAIGTTVPWFGLASARWVAG